MLNYIKTFENFIIDKYLQLKLYSVQYWKDDSNISIIYYGTDYDKAENVFKSFDTNGLDGDIKGEYDRKSDSYSIFIEFLQKVNEYKWIGDKNDDVNAGYYPLSEYYDTSYYELVKEGEYELIDSKDVETTESISNREEKELEQSLINDIITHIKSITSEYKYAAFLGSTFYALREYRDGFIMFRVADHFFNINNVQIGKNVLYEYIDIEGRLPEYRNIYGFISLNILNSDYIDKKGFRKEFREWKEYNHELKDLVDFIDLNISNSDYEGWETELSDIIETMESDIDIVLYKGVFD